MKVIEPEELPAELFNLICEYDPDIMELSWGGRDQQISYIHDKLEKGDTAGFTSLLEQIREEGMPDQQKKAEALLEIISALPDPKHEDELDF